MGPRRLNMGPRCLNLGPRHIETENMYFMGPRRTEWVRVALIWVRDIFRVQKTEIVGPRRLYMGPRHLLWVRDGLRNKSLLRLRLVQ